MKYVKPDTLPGAADLSNNTDSDQCYVSSSYIPGIVVNTEVTPLGTSHHITCRMALFVEEETEPQRYERSRTDPSCNCKY